MYRPEAPRMRVDEESFGVVLLALPLQSRRRHEEILETLEPFPARVMTVPDIAYVAASSARLENVRDMVASDLLGCMSSRIAA